jgi:hypothetical protein
MEIIIGSGLYARVIFLFTRFGQFLKERDNDIPKQHDTKPYAAPCEDCGKSLPVSYWYGGNHPYCYSCAKELLK